MNKADNAAEIARLMRVRKRTVRLLPLRAEIDGPTLCAFREFVFAASGSRSNNYVSQKIEQLLQDFLESEGIQIEASPTLISQEE